MPKLTAYEEQRLKNIERNRQLLAGFDINKARDDLLDTTATPTTPTPSSVKFRIKNSPISKLKKPAVPPKRRQSSRLRGIEAPTIEVNENDRVASDKSEQQDLDDDDVNDGVWDGVLLKADQYFDSTICKNAIRTNGKFTGWVNADLVEKYQLEMSAQEAWEKNGGGKFSYRDPLGTGKKQKPGGTGRNSAKAIAQMMFKKNPNMYFYRHTEPGVEKWTGDWTEEEKETFIKIVKTYGCGDKWGLFASYIPHRVGYQCSNFYRSVILPSGIVFDDNYHFSPSGKSFYVGPHGTRSS